MYNMGLKLFEEASGYNRKISSRDFPGGKVPRIDDFINCLVVRGKLSKDAIDLHTCI